VKPNLRARKRAGILLLFVILACLLFANRASGRGDTRNEHARTGWEKKTRKTILSQDGFKWRKVTTAKSSLSKR